MVQREKSQEGVLVVMRYFDAFAGIGGFALGIQNAYKKSRFRTSINNRRMSYTEGKQVRAELLCVGYSEIDKYASSVYERHFPEHKTYGDITKINTNELPEFDILVGGFPCQTFSIAGKRAGFEDTRGTLFFELARLLRDKQPSYCVFENVKGLISHDNGRTFRTIIETLDGIGYDLQWEVLNSKYFGVPQNRERIFIIGNLRGRPRPEVFPIGGSNQEDIVLPSRRVYDPDGLAPTIPTGTGGGVMPKILSPQVSRSESGRKVHHEITDIAPTIRATQYKSGDNQPKVTNGSRIRRLTPLECERLQAFPDHWTLHGKDGEQISDTQRYKTLGNAVTVNVVEAIFEKLFLSLNEMEVNNDSIHE